MAVFAAADASLRARAVREAMDLETAPSNINNVRLKLERLAEQGILAETEQRLFTLPWPQPLPRVATDLLSATERPNRASPQVPPSGGALSPR